MTTQPQQPKTTTLKTKAGTELPMLDLKGKPYLQVAHRLVWFREEHPTWTIETEQLNIDIEKGQALFVVRIKDENDRLIANATGHETRGDFADFIEKAETKAVGRALAMCGYGTQFAPELDEGARIVDSPMQPAKFAPRPAASPKATAATQSFNESLPPQGPHAGTTVPPRILTRQPVSKVGQAIKKSMDGDA